MNRWGSINEILLDRDNIYWLIELLLGLVMGNFVIEILRGNFVKRDMKFSHSI